MWTNVLLTLSLCCLSPHVDAWGDYLHQVVTGIALEELSGKTQLRFNDWTLKTLSNFKIFENIQEASGFVDLLPKFNETKFQPTWHFITLRSGESFDESWKEVNGKDDMNIFKVLKAFMDQAKDATWQTIEQSAGPGSFSSNTPEDMSLGELFVYFIHLFADAHQPLHTKSHHKPLEVTSTEDAQKTVFVEGFKDNHDSGSDSLRINWKESICAIPRSTVPACQIKLPYHRPYSKYYLQATPKEEKDEIGEKNLGPGSVSLHVLWDLAGGTYGASPRLPYKKKDVRLQAQKDIEDDVQAIMKRFDPDEATQKKLEAYDLTWDEIASDADYFKDILHESFKVEAVNLDFFTVTKFKKWTEVEIENKCRWPRQRPGLKIQLGRYENYEENTPNEDLELYSFTLVEDTRKEYLQQINEILPGIRPGDDDR